MKFVKVLTFHNHLLIQYHASSVSIINSEDNTLTLGKYQLANEDVIVWQADLVNAEGKKSTWKSKHSYFIQLRLTSQ